jgi:small subunit ribosomal protein S7
MAVRIRTIQKVLYNNWNADPIYKSVWMTKFTGNLIKKGYKELAENLLYRSFKNLKYLDKIVPYLPLMELVQQIKPIVQAPPKRVGSQWYNIPTPLVLSRQYKLGFKYILVSLIRRRHQQNAIYWIVDGIQSALKNYNIDVEKKRAYMAHLIFENRTRAHFRWK